METDTERARRRFNRVKRETLRRGKRIASRGKRGFFSILFSRSGLIGVMLLAQLILFVALSLWIQPYASKYFMISGTIGGLVVLYIINSRSDSTAKITWLFLILLMPLFGIALYIYTQTDIGHRRLKRRRLSGTRNTRSRRTRGISTRSPARVPTSRGSCPI